MGNDTVRDCTATHFSPADLECQIRCFNLLGVRDSGQPCAEKPPVMNVFIGLSETIVA